MCYKITLIQKYIPYTHSQKYQKRKWANNLFQNQKYISKNQGKFEIAKEGGGFSQNNFGCKHFGYPLRGNQMCTDPKWIKSKGH